MGRYNGDQGKYTCLPDIYPPSQPIHGRDTGHAVGPPPPTAPPPPGPHRLQMGHRPQPPPPGHVVGHGHMHHASIPSGRQPPHAHVQAMPKPPPPPMYTPDHMVSNGARYPQPPPPPPEMGPSSGSYSAAVPQNAGMQHKPLPAGQPTSVPIEKVIDDISVMGFSREEVRSVLRELTAQGKAVDMNIVLDRLGAR